MDIWSILRRLGIFHSHLVCNFEIFPVLVRCTKKNLATLPGGNPTIVNYNASAVKIYNASYSMERITHICNKILQTCVNLGKIGFGRIGS
jgi:hypothetical protein